MLLIHPSSLGKIMTEPKSKGETLSVGAKTYIAQLAKEFIYGYREQISSKPMTKGTRLEDDAIELYNRVMFTNHIKNHVTYKNEWLIGTCDINAPDRIIDIKCSWSLSTFPALKDDAINKDYEWQGRAYMMLYDKPLFENAFVMLSTPDDLISYEQLELHQVDHIPEELRLTTVQYARDLALEEKIKENVEGAQKYYEEVIETITQQHQY
jgi:hypothetical protein